MTSRFVAVALRLGAGIAVWAAHFALVYGMTSVACARGMADRVPALVGLATLVAAAAAAALVVREARRCATFEGWIACGLAALALVAILYQGVPAGLAPRCG
jgi:hypothetical protein